MVQSVRCDDVRHDICDVIIVKYDKKEPLVLRFKSCRYRLKFIAMQQLTTFRNFVDDSWECKDISIVIDAVSTEET